ncbi:MAG TPA: helix-turn-helix transcriptional regulator [Burkholderiaceae bacterium]|jgi:DNA-binding transcriptional ArsR family regulator|nr:helix-turn-helix transcriptional regulator [Burkholderiaceae bacterium]
MKDGPNIARIAGLIGEPARAEMLTALLGGRALTATELAAAAGVTKQTTSAHLSKLLEAKLLAVQAQGRHRYFRLADDEVAHALETLAGVAFRSRPTRLVTGPREPALRKARVCYDHLAGELSVMVYHGLLASGSLASGTAGLCLSEAGLARFRDLGVDVDAVAQQRRVFCRPCLDWGERRDHLAGALGAALLQRIYELRWAARVKDSRVVEFTAVGEQNLRSTFAT